MIEHLPDHPSTSAPATFAGPDHPMRKLTRAVALDEAWSADDAARVTSVFDGLAPDWSRDHVDDVKAAPVRDALERGEVPVGGRWLELGSGTGAGTRVLAEAGHEVIANDLSTEMLRHAPAALAPRVRSDASTLPFPDDTFDAVVMVNMLLFPREVARVLRPAGVVIWVNTLGDQTPIHLPPDDVITALPGAWSGRSARAGTGFWLTASRT
ncbi:MAG: class I SAM-dependent methyltransferase [Ilumatobacteraceae bacterium]